MAEPTTAASLDIWARWLRQRRLETPAILLVESLKPLQVLVHQLLIFSSPFLDIAGLPTGPIVDLWADSGSLEELLNRLEDPGESGPLTP